MKALFSAFLATLAFTTLLSTTSLAVEGGGDPIDCARQYRNCLRQCNQTEAEAKSTKATCERNAYATYKAGSQLLKQALEACRRDYALAMSAVAECRNNCKLQYQNCLGGGEGGGEQP